MSGGPAAPRPAMRSHKRRIREIEQNPEILLEMEQEEADNKQPKHTATTAPGLQFSSGKCRLFVGRTAIENDTLLRRYAKGNDWWLHTRDYAGGYVFIRPPAGKSVPLEVLLDAGNLAIWFSKARNAGRADLYYTQVKYLKRIKSGKKGMVTPTQEKNLTVDLEEQRLQRLLGAR